MAKVTTRPATHADCHSIKAINKNIYEGLDYFLYAFHQRVPQNNAFPIVAEIGGTIAGYTCGRVIEDGEVIVFEATRVSKSHGGQNISGKLLGSALSAAIKRFPTLKEIQWSSGYRLATSKAMEKNPYIKITLHVLMVMFNTSSRYLNTLYQGKLFHDMEELYNVEAIEAVPKQQALELLTKEIRFLSCTPDEIMVMWQPCGWRYSTLAEQFAKSNLYISRCQTTGKIVAFSFHTVRETDKGPWAMIDFYGEVQGPYQDLVISHLLYHIREMSLMPSHNHITCTYQFPKQLDRDYIVSIVKEKLGLNIMDLYKEAMLLSEILESKFPKNKL